MTSSSAVRTWFDNTAHAVGDNAALRPYAILLSLAHSLTGVAWFAYRNVALLLSDDNAVCWPLFPACYHLRPFVTPTAARAAVSAYIAAGFAGATLFAIRRSRAGLGTFLLATAMGTFLYALDFRLRFNETYMFGWVVLVFLFAPRKAAAIEALVAIFYFWAGTLKLDTEWVTGAALYAKPLLVPANLIPASCVYVLILEMVFIWALFARRLHWRIATYLQLLLFHTVSWGVVGYFYPLQMFALTAIYPLVWFRTPDQSLTLAGLLSGGYDRATRWSVGTIAGAFSAFQLVPHLFPGDTAITGEGRLFSLHMFDAKIQCEGGAVVTTSRGERFRVPLAYGAVRFRCDPIVILANAQQLCSHLDERDTSLVSVNIDAKRTTDDRMQPLVHVNDFCHQTVTYSVWHHNAWIGN